MQKVFDKPQQINHTNAMNEPTILDTPNQINMFRLLAIRSGLKLEIETGLRHSRNMIFNAAKQITHQRTRKRCLEVINQIIKENSWQLPFSCYTNANKQKQYHD